MNLTVFSAELRRMTDLTNQLIQKDTKMNNKIETQERNLEASLEINLEDMQPMKDDELKTVAGGGPTLDWHRDCHYQN